MSRLTDSLERRFGNWAIPNLTFILLIAQIATTGLAMMRKLELYDVVLQWNLVFAGEWWRVVTFGILPRLGSGDIGAFSLLFAAFALYIFYFMGTALEAAWGHFKFNLFVLTGWLLTLLLALIVPQAFFGNIFLIMALFIAFAQLQPNLQFMLFLVIPVKVKWLAWLTWAILILTLITGSLSSRLECIAAILTLALFFGRSLITGVETTVRNQRWQQERMAAAAEPMHTCVICKRTNLTHPDLDFRYDDGVAFCEDHLDQAEIYHETLKQIESEQGQRP